MPQPLIYTPSDRPTPINVIGEELTILASKSQTAGYELFHQDGKVGQGPPPHHHAWDEAFFVLKGSIEFGVDDRQLTATPGTLVHIPGGSVHWFRFIEDGEMLSITGPGSGAAAFFTQVSETVKRPDDIDNLVKSGDDHKVMFLPLES